MYDGPQWTCSRTWSNSLCFLDTVLPPSVFAGWLIEPSLDVPLPVLVEVNIWDNVVALRRHDSTVDWPLENKASNYGDAVQG